MSPPLPVCDLNGEYLPLAAARISPLDRGFLFGDAVYEVLPVTRLDGAAVGEGRPGPLWKRMHAAFDSRRRKPPHGVQT